MNLGLVPIRLNEAVPRFRLTTKNLTFAKDSYALMANAFHIPFRRLLYAKASVDVMVAMVHLVVPVTVLDARLRAL